MRVDQVRAGSTSPGTSEHANSDIEPNQEQQDHRTTQILFQQHWVVKVTIQKIAKKTNKTSKFSCKSITISFGTENM